MTGFYRKQLWWNTAKHNSCQAVELIDSEQLANRRNSLPPIQQAGSLRQDGRRSGNFLIALIWCFVTQAVSLRTC